MSRNDTNKKTFGVGVDSNITRASIKSIISALNRLYGSKIKIFILIDLKFMYIISFIS